MDYLIHTPNYKRTSGGVRVLHKLCHCLNQAGQVAYISASGHNPKWNTPRATQEVASHLAQEGIVIYPEVVRGNPRSAKRVVRYILNRPGLLGGDKEYASTETLFCYSAIWREYVSSDDRILTVPVIDTDIFHNKSEGERSGGVFWVGNQGRSAPRIPETSGLVEITFSWPGSFEELADLFRRSEIFYSYTASTGLVPEARLCGCPAVVIPGEQYTWGEFEKGLGAGTAGLAFWDSSPEVFVVNLHRAQETVSDYFDSFRKHEEMFECQLENFIRITQGLK